MAPDLNSVPPSPRPAQTQASSTSQAQAQPDSRRASAAPSRRASQIYPMNPPPLPLASPGGTIPASVQAGHIPFPPLSPSASGSASEMGVQVPMRHPRPMTPAEMHLELEKEQEAIVNRLTRELSALRAHSSSVASTTSISSSSTHDHMPNSAGLIDSASHTHPAGTRSRHRSSSSVSASHRAPPLAATDPTASTPSAAARTSSVSAGGPLMPTTPRYEEVLLHRAELEEAKKENDRLRRRVRELEAMVRGRRASSVSTRGDASASASVSERDRSVSVRRGPPEQIAGAENGTSG